MDISSFFTQLSPNDTLVLAVNEHRSSYQSLDDAATDALANISSKAVQQEMIQKINATGELWDLRYDDLETQTFHNYLGESLAACVSQASAWPQEVNEQLKLLQVLCSLAQRDEPKDPEERPQKNVFIQVIPQSQYESIPYWDNWNVTAEPTSPCFVTVNLYVSANAYLPIAGETFAQVLPQIQRQLLLDGTLLPTDLPLFDQHAQDSILQQALSATMAEWNYHGAKGAETLGRWVKYSKEEMLSKVSMPSSPSPPRVM